MRLRRQLCATVAVAGIFQGALADPALRARATAVEYACDAKVQAYSVPFAFREAAQILVYRSDEGNPQAFSPLVSTKDYTVQGSAATAKVVLTSSKATCAGSALVLRIVRRTVGGDAPSTVADQVDRLRMQVEELRDAVDQSQEAAGELSVTSRGATVPRTLSERLADVANVRDFGALGDGRTDDTRAVNAAYAATRTRRGGTIFFPPGTYLLNIRIVDKNIRLLGSGYGDDNTPGATVLRPYSPKEPALQIGDGKAAVSSIEVSHLSVIGDGQSPSGDGIVVLGAAHVSIHQVWVSSFGRDNVSLTSSNSQPTQFVYFSDFISKWARGAGLKAVYGPKWTTAINLSNFTISGHHSMNSWTVHLDGVTLQAVNGYMDVHGEHGLYLKRSGVFPNPGLLGSQVFLDVQSNAPEASVTFDPTLAQTYVAAFITGVRFGTRSLARWLSNSATVSLGLGASGVGGLLAPHVLGKLVMAKQGMPGSTDIENRWGRLSLEDYTGQNPYWNLNTDANDSRVAVRVPGSRQYPLQFQTGNGALFVDAGTRQLKFSRSDWWPHTDASGFAVSVFVPVPAAPTAACQPGDWSADDRFLYVCRATDSWRRVAVQAW